MIDSLTRHRARLGGRIATGCCASSITFGTTTSSRRSSCRRWSTPMREELHDSGYPYAAAPLASSEVDPATDRAQVEYQFFEQFRGQPRAHPEPTRAHRPDRVSDRARRRFGEDRHEHGATAALVQGGRRLSREGSRAQPARSLPARDVQPRGRRARAGQRAAQRQLADRARAAQRGEHDIARRRRRLGDARLHPHAGAPRRSRFSGRRAAPGAQRPPLAHRALPERRAQRLDQQSSQLLRVRDDPAARAHRAAHASVVHALQRAHVGVPRVRARDADRWRGRSHARSPAARPAPGVAAHALVPRRVRTHDGVARGILPALQSLRARGHRSDCSRTEACTCSARRILRDRSDQLLDPSNGNQLHLELRSGTTSLDTANGTRFSRVLAEGAVYKTVGARRSPRGCRWPRCSTDFRRAAPRPTCLRRSDSTREARTPCAATARTCSGPWCTSWTRLR